MKPDLSRTSTLATPSRVRYGVLGFGCALSMITYLDRVCIASAVNPILHVLQLESIADLNWAFAGFTFAYAAFEIPSGWLGDVFGPRNVLIRIVLWWSLFTALTGLTGLPVAVLQTVGFLIVVRFLFGMGEAGAYPNITRALHNWIPLQQRGLAQGAVWMSGRGMGGFTPVLWMLLVEWLGMSWRLSFWLFGILGFVWCLLFAAWFRNRPEENPNVNDAELELIRAGRRDRESPPGRVPWTRFLRSGNLWCLCLMYFCGAYGWYFNITYLPTFLEEQYGVDRKSLVGAIYKGGPLWMGAIACLAGGWLTDWLVRRTGSRKWGRRTWGILGHGLSAVCYLSCLGASSTFTFFLAISLAAFFNDLTMGAAWATCQDIGKRYAAIVAGCMNTVGNMGGAVAGWATGAILQRSMNAYAQVSEWSPGGELGKAAGLMRGYQINFICFAVVYAIAVFLWLRIDATEPLDTERELVS
jgi:ACS family glucarate transporter-like MFS transporter